MSHSGHGAICVVAGTCKDGIGGFYPDDSSAGSIESLCITCSLPNASNLLSVVELDMSVPTDIVGPTQTIKLFSASPAIGAEGTGCETVDQRDFIRTCAREAAAYQTTAAIADELFRNSFDC
jgi:hypothetical protein